MRVNLKGGIYIRNNYGCLYGRHCQFQQNGPEQGKKEKPVKGDEVQDAEVVRVDEKSAESVQPVIYENQGDRIRQAIEFLDKNNLIKYKYSLAAVKQMLLERQGMNISNSEFVEIISSCSLKKESYPSEQNLKKVVFSNNSKHPNWKIYGFRQDKLQNMTQLGSIFWDYFSKN